MEKERTMQSTDLEEGKRRAVGASSSSLYTDKLGSGTSHGSEVQEGTAAGSASRARALVSGGICDHFSR